MERADIGATALARLAETSKQNISRWAKGERELPAEWARRLAPLLGVGPADLIFASAPSSIPIVGIAGASADGALSYEFDSGELGEAPMLPWLDVRSVAVEVRGDSLRGVAEDGWLVYYDDRREPLTDDLLGELCVVGLEDGRTLIKTPHRGSAPGLFNLESTNAPTLRDVGVRWAASVTAIVPRRPARQLIRRRA